MERLSWRAIKSSNDAERNESVEVKEKEKKEQIKSILTTAG